MLRLAGGALFALGLCCAVAASPQTGLSRWEGGAKPPIALDSLDDGRVAVDDAAGRVVLVHFFATWCAPCVEEMASLERLAARRRDEGLTVVAIDVREVDARVRKFFGEHPVSFPVLLDRDGAATRAWQVMALPTSFVLASGLSPALFAEHDVDWDHPDVNAQLDELIRVRPGQDGREVRQREENDDDEPT